ncbi:MAG: hypothetical protein JSU81_03985, partial [Candidatus Coatesbacteria bacterium]
MRALILIGALALTWAFVTAAAQEPVAAGAEYGELRREVDGLKRDVEELGREDERLGEEVDEVKENVAGRIHDVGVSVHTLHIVVIVFSLILTSVVVVLGYRQARSVKDLKADFEKNEEVIRRIELDARQTVGEMKGFAERA